MRRPIESIQWVGPVGLLSLLSACSGAPGGPATSDVESVSDVEQAATASTYFYFRCNATGWGVNGATLLVNKTDDPDVVELAYNVKAQWMTESGDECVITETPAHNAWGAWQKDYGLGVDDQISEPGADFLR